MEYDVCLSFAREDRAYVDDVAANLRARAVRVFYDKYERATLWGKNLYTHLDQVYRHAARYCVIFISEHYQRRVWTNHERESAQARALFEPGAYILPARFDDTDLPGLPPTIGHVDLRSIGPEELADLICEKLQASAPAGMSPDSGEVVFRWSEPIQLKLGDSLEGLLVYQAMPMVARLSGLDEVVARAMRRLTLLGRRDGDGLYWSHFNDRKFDRLYATASVSTALAQLGADMDAFPGRAAIEYLSDTDPASVDDRAATVFRLVSGRLTESQTLLFIDMLRGLQLPLDHAEAGGSFLLPQGPVALSGSLATNWIAAPLHAGGANFHACHVSDVLLHIPRSYDLARARAQPILDGLREFFVGRLRRNDGWLVDIKGMPTPQTLYGYAVCPSLSIPLPSKWRQIAKEIITGMLKETDDATTRYLGLMNAWYLDLATRDPEFSAEARDFASGQLATLVDGHAIASQSAVDLSLFLRALNCAVRMVDSRLAPSMVLAARNGVAAMGIGLERGGVL